MPVNLSPEYKCAEAAFRKARIRDLGEELEGGGHKGGARGGPVLAIRPEGAAQVALIGAPNAGKSSLHARLTGSRAPTRRCSWLISGSPTASIR